MTERQVEITATIVATYHKTGIRAVPGKYTVWSPAPRDNELACACPIALVALYLGAAQRKASAVTMRHLFGEVFGVTEDFAVGVEEGFDGGSDDLRSGDCRAGIEVGRAVRVAMGLA